MKFLSRMIAGLALGGSLISAAVVVNDGTTTDGLVRLAPAPTSGIQNTTLAKTPDENLQARVTQDFFDLAMHTAWYATAYVATGNTFTVSAEFTPEATEAYLDGGVVAWLDQDTSQGMLFALRSKATGQYYCQVAVYDFNFGTSISSLLFDTEGNEVDPGFQPPYVPESPTLPNYVPASPLRLEVSFEPPSEEDLLVVPNATARLTAVALQNSGSGDQTVTTPIVLLTTLPQPATGEKLTGYYAVYNNYLDWSGPIGRLDNLILDGEFDIGNQLPTISLTAPQDGQQFASGEPITLTASADDADGVIAQVEFFAGTDRLSVVNQAPYSYVWTTAEIGSQVLTAVAMDDRGATSTSMPVSIAVTNRPPIVNLTQPSDGEIFPPGSEILITAEVSDPDGSIVLVQFLVDDALLSGSTVPPFTTTWYAGEEGTFQLTAVAVDDRDATSTSAPVTVRIGQTSVEPAVMTVDVEAGQVHVTWDRTGFQLQYAFSVLGPWVDVAQNTTGVTAYSEPLSGQPKYFRLEATGVVPSGPTLAIEPSGSDITLRWDQTGYQLQKTAALGSAWVDVNTDTTGLREITQPISDPGSFFRLQR